MKPHSFIKPILAEKKTFKLYEAAAYKGKRGYSIFMALASASKFPIEREKANKYPSAIL